MVIQSNKYYTQKLLPYLGETTAYHTMENSVIHTKVIYPIRDNDRTFVLIQL